jgi:CheY-like chemotaxis protein
MARRDRTSAAPRALSMERRRHARAAIVAGAVVWLSPERSARYVAKNLSLGGVLLGGGPLLAAGRTVRITLRLRGGATIMVDAELVRSGRAMDPHGGIAAAFRNLNASQEDAIQEALLSALEEERRGQILPRCALVVDGEDPSRDLLSNELARLGHQVVSAATPLDAIVRLQDPDAHFDIVFVDLDSSNLRGTDLLVFLANHHPAVRRVVVSGRINAEQWRHNRFMNLDDEVLTKPWTQETLRAVVRL